MPELSDFKRGDVRYTDFATEVTLWGKKIKFDTAFEEELGKTEETLAAALPAINDKLAFIEQNAEAIKLSTTAEAHLDERANDWEYEAYEENGGDPDEYVEITAEQFREGLFPVALGVEFSESTERCQAYLELLCEPDYFAGHRIHIEIDEENEIGCEGI